MEQVLQELKNYSRWLKLEAEMPGLEDALAEAKALRIEAGGSVRVAQWELDRLEKPGFFQRLKGGLEERKEEVWREYRAAQAKLQSAQEEVDLRAQELQRAREEFSTLSGSWEAYLREKTRFDGLVDGEIRLLAAIAIGLTKDCQEALEEARTWMRADVMRRGVAYDNRKLEFLGIAREKAGRLVNLLEQLPEGMIEIPGYLRNPDGFILGFAMEFKQLDQINLAIEQVWDLRQKLKNL